MRKVASSGLIAFAFIVFMLCHVFFFILEMEIEAFFLYYGALLLLWGGIFLLQREDIRFWRLNIMVLSFLFPWIGFFITLIILFTVNRSPEGSYIEAYSEYIKYEEADERLLQIKNSNKVIEDKLNTRSYADIIHKHGAIEEKIEVIHELQQIQTMWAVDLLKETQRDPSPEISYIAATALIAIENPILEDIDLWEQKLKDKPDSIEAHRRLGALYYNYCYLGILDDFNRKNYLAKASEMFEFVLVNKSSMSDVLLEAGKVYIARNMYDKCNAVLKKYMDVKPDDVNGYVWYAELLFRQKKYKSLIEFMTNKQDKVFHKSGVFEKVAGVWV